MAAWNKAGRQSGQMCDKVESVMCKGWRVGEVARGQMKQGLGGGGARIDAKEILKSEGNGIWDVENMRGGLRNL